MSRQLTIIILTFNEENNLPFCLESVNSLQADVVVIDSYSTDGTVQIAKANGARVYQRAFVNQAEQFNWALDNVPIESKWVLRLDADEYLLPNSIPAIHAAMNLNDGKINGFSLIRRFVFMDKWIRHGAYYPIEIVRLFRVGYGRSEMSLMDEHIVVDSGAVVQLDAEFVDHNHNGISAWMAKHVGYAVRQGLALESAGKSHDNIQVRPRLLGTQVERKRWFKSNLYARLPLFLRVGALWTYRYVLRLGFLDGLEGFMFHSLHAGWYMFLVDCLIYEERKREILEARTK